MNKLPKNKSQAEKVGIKSENSSKKKATDLKKN